MDKYIRAIVANAKSALKTYRDYLSTDVLVRSDGDFRIGERDYVKLVNIWMGSGKLGIGDMRGDARRELEKVSEDFFGELEKVTGKEDAKFEDYDDLFTLHISTDAPADAAGALRAIEAEARATEQFFNKSRLFYPLEEKITVEDEPEYLRGKTPFAFYSAPNAMDSRRDAKFYAALPDSRLPEDKRKEIMRAAFNAEYIKLLVLSELSPGRHMRDYESVSASRVRRLGTSPLLANGWAAYAQSFAVEKGYSASPYTRLVWLKWRLVRAARAMADIQLHSGRMTYDDALKFLVDNAGLNMPQARAELMRISLSPGEAASYILGEAEIAKLKDKIRKEFGARKFEAREFHRKLMSVGNIPLSVLEIGLREAYGLLPLGYKRSR